MKQRITSTKQLKRSAFWLLLSAFVSYHALKNQWIDLKQSL
jgi:hypothetical protein